MIGIYKITSPSGRVYVGQSWDIERRLQQHKRGKSSNAHLKNSILSYGLSAHDFEIIEIVPIHIAMQFVLDRLEAKYMRVFESESGKKLMNLKEAGASGRHSPETLEKFKQKKSALHIERMRQALIGKPRSQAAKEALSKARTGIKIDEKYLPASRANVARIQSLAQAPESRAKRAASVKAWWANATTEQKLARKRDYTKHPVSQETREKLSAAVKGKPRPERKKVVELNKTIISKP